MLFDKLGAWLKRARCLASVYLRRDTPRLGISITQQYIIERATAFTAQQTFKFMWTLREKRPLRHILAAPTASIAGVVCYVSSFSEAKVVLLAFCGQFEGVYLVRYFFSGPVTGQLLKRKLVFGVHRPIGNWRRKIQKKKTLTLKTFESQYEVMAYASTDRSILISNR